MELPVAFILNWKCSIRPARCRDIGSSVRSMPNCSTFVKLDAGLLNFQMNVELIVLLLFLS